MLTKENLDKLVEEGWLISQNHPILDLTIYNYSQKTQYEKYWNETTLACRGLVMNSKGKIVAYPFPKFFNSSELSEETIPQLPFETYEKMDGSLGVFFWYPDSVTEELVPVFASRGSFTSEQAVKGWEMLQKYPFKNLYPFHTYLFEIIYPENRIVVDYGGEEKLVLLSVYHNSGREISREDIEDHLKDSFDLVKAYNLTESWKHLMSLDEPNREGFVIRFSNGFRMKVKFAEYVRLHRIITNVSTLDVWRALKDNGNLDSLLENVPDEFYDWVRGVEKDLLEKKADLLSEAHQDFSYIINNVLGYEASRKEYAMEFLKHPQSAIFFKWLDGNRGEVDQIAWTQLRPEFSKPFWKNKENL
jgi:hypothetical protein